jgi:glycerophosphoryl diester phosphodiesterase
MTRTTVGGVGAPAQPARRPCHASCVGIPAGFLQWAHQGGAREGPSNTLWALRRAVHEVGVNALEFDVRRSRDKVLVVVHDRRLGRVSKGFWPIAWMKLARIKEVDAAYWWVRGKTEDHHAGPYELRGQDVRIPTVDEVLEEFRDLPLTIEIKTMRAAKPLAELLRARGRSNVTLTALFGFRLWPVKRSGFDLAPGLGFLLWFRFVKRAKGPYTRLQTPVKKFGITFLDDDGTFVRAARNAGLKVDAWTIDDPEEMERLIRMGVDGIMTDCPSVLAGVVGELAAEP